ncbi:hypothetical protein BHE74_00050467 [Ensete ventricosum]|nr:hypothetical protein GW17_00045795 [Ensete ventricosum]RWW43835.1 hypothetical protein BHE74_00050467 [Ensete ventricosum]
MESWGHVRADLADHVCGLPILRAGDISPEAFRGRANTSISSQGACLWSIRGWALMCSVRVAATSQLMVGFLLQIPFYVATKMVSTKQSSTFVPSPDDYAKAAVDWIGHGTRCTPYWSHSLQWCFTCFIPDFVLHLWRFHVGITNRNQAVRSKEA